jgi:DEAD/DEAH box helicase domain-containing protein
MASAGLDPVQVLSAVHAAEHAMIGMLPLFTICDRWDVGGVSMAMHPATGEPTIFVYDGYPGGAGIAELAFEAADRHLSAALAVIEACPCRRGCPSCVQSPKCGNWNEYLDKEAAASLLRAVVR